MKAWVVWWGEEYCTLMHAETRGLAKLRGLEFFGHDDYLQVRALRLPGLDDKPITYQNAKEAGFQYTCEDCYNEEIGEDGLLRPDLFTNDCKCDICNTT